MHVSRRWWQRTHPYFSKYEGKRRKINNGSALIHPIMIRRMRKISYIKCFSLEYTSATMYVFKDGSVYEPIPMPISIPNTKYRMNEGLSSSFSPPYPSLLLTRSAIQIRVYVCRSVNTPVSMRTEKKTIHAHKSISTYTYLLACTRVSIPCYPLPYIPFHLFCLRIIMQKRHILILAKKSVKGTYIPTRPCTCVLPT